MTTELLRLICECGVSWTGGATVPTVCPACGKDGTVTCQHQVAMDVHCCHCHSGFIFDPDHVCSEVEAGTAGDRIDAITARLNAARAEAVLAFADWMGGAIDPADVRLFLNIRGWLPQGPKEGQ